jgi:hypothetical protein
MFHKLAHTPPLLLLLALLSLLSLLEVKEEEPPGRTITKGKG